MKLVILGATGSIGTQALEVVEELRGVYDIEVIGLSGNRNLKLLEEQIRRFSPAFAAVPDEGDAKTLATAVADTGCRILSGQEGLRCLAAETGADMVGCDYNLVSEHTFQVGHVVENNTADQTGELDGHTYVCGTDAEGKSRFEAALFFGVVPD